MEEKYEDLIKQLIKSTKEGKIEWKKSSTEYQYRLELKSATFVIDRSQLSTNFHEIVNTAYELTMYNNRNVEITIAKEKYESLCFGDSLLYQLYCAAEESCLKETETIKKVMKELNDLDLPF